MSRSTRSSRHQEAGYVALLVAILASTVFLGLAALGVDTARWYVEAERLQKAADAASLAGVVYMPNNLASARTTAIDTAAKNGYTADSRTTVTVAQGDRASQLLVTISRVVDNSFGAALGVKTTTITRSATADFTAPAPMGSPCNTFGNEPRSSSGAAQPVGTALPSSSFSNCPKDPTTGTSQPQFWSAIEGPETDKLQGDRYQTRKCSEVGNASETAAGCTSGTNDEYRDEGYFYSVHVEEAVVTSGATLSVQVYDGGFSDTGVYCGGLPKSTALSNDMNPFASTDGLQRYGRVNTNGQSDATDGAEEYCSGDLSPGSNVPDRMPTTSFVMRGVTDTGNPLNAAVLGACTPTQIKGMTAPTATALRSSEDDYNPEQARVFHQWFEVCSFKPTEPGDYYLQVRTNIGFGGTPYSTNENPNNKIQDSVISKGNAAVAGIGPTTTQGAGANSFSLRVVPSVDSARSQVAISSFERMPLLQISPDSTATFNLVRALPATQGQYISFEFFDAADGAAGSVKVVPPSDAGGSVTAAGGVPGCRAGLNETPPASYDTLDGCSYSVNGTRTDGQIVKMVIPIPSDYTCDSSTLGGCWFQVKMAYSGKVTDLTTWSANIGGDPVRLVK